MENSISKVFLALMFGTYLMSKVVVAQEVEHNYKVGPQQTNCDSLELMAEETDVVIDLLKTTKFRFQESFNLTRRVGFKGGDFYSCNNQTGFLIIRYHDDQFLYKGVSMDFWNGLTNSSDPEGYYLKNKPKMEEL